MTGVWSFQEDSASFVCLCIQVKQLTFSQFAADKNINQCVM